MSGSKYDEEFWRAFTKKYATARDVRIAAIFNPPASMNDILAAEDHIGFRLPDQVRAAYRCFDGQKRLKEVNGEPCISDFQIFPAIDRCHSLREAIVRWDMYRSMESDAAAYSRYDDDKNFENVVFVTDNQGGYEVMPLTGGPATHWPVPFDRRRFPLGMEGHVAIWVDMNPRPGGKLGQIVKSIITDSAYWVATSYGAYCERLVDLIESKKITWKGRWKYTSTGKDITNIFLDDEVR